VIPGIDVSAHIGGFVCGLVLGAAFARHLAVPPDVRALWRRGIFVVAAVALLMIFSVVRQANGPRSARSESEAEGK
jgi:cyanate permease